MGVLAQSKLFSLLPNISLPHRPIAFWCFLLRTMTPSRPPLPLRVVSSVRDADTQLSGDGRSGNPIFSGLQRLHGRVDYQLQVFGAPPHPTHPSLSLSLPAPTPSCSTSAHFPPFSRCVCVAVTPPQIAVCVCTCVPSALWKNLEGTRSYEWDTLDFEEQVALRRSAVEDKRLCPACFGCLPLPACSVGRVLSWCWCCPRPGARLTASWRA